MRFPDQDNHYYLQFPFLVPQFFPLLRWYNRYPRQQGRALKSGSWELMCILPPPVQRGEKANFLNVYVFPLGKEGKSSWVCSLQNINKCLHRVGKTTGVYNKGFYPPLRCKHREKQVSKSFLRSAGYSITHPRLVLKPSLISLLRKP